MVDLFFIGIGIYLIIGGATFKHLISESDVVASKEDRENAKATPMGRFIVISTGLSMLIYGVVDLIRTRAL